MGHTLPIGAQEVKPVQTEGLDDDASLLPDIHPGEELAPEKLAELMEEFRNMPSEEDMTDCIHVMDPNRMVDMEGYTVSHAAPGIIITPVSIKRI